MEGNCYKLSGEKSLAVPCGDADKLISLADGTGALLYIYALRMNGSFTSRQAARDLCRTESEIVEAAEVLRKQGLFSPDGIVRPAPSPSEELPQYTAEDIARRVGENDEFRLIVDETQRIFGRMLSSADIKTLFGIYDNLGLPPEVILLLLNHCVEETQSRNGPGKLPSMRTIEKEAFIWHNNEILTLDMAEDYLCRQRERSSLLSEIRQILQINGRNFSSTERGYAESWAAMGFSADAIALAYDRTVIKTGGMQWKYMNTILQSWHGKNLHTAEEAIRGDVKPASGSSAALGNAAPRQESDVQRGSAELARLEKILNKVKNG